MKKMTSPPCNREALGFVNSTRQAFKFLEDRFGMKCVRIEPPTFVRFENEIVFVNVYHGRLSYEIGIEVGLRMCKEIPSLEDAPYSLSDILKYLGVLEKSDYFKPTATTSSLVQEFIALQAEIVSKYLPEVLEGKMEVYKKFISVSMDEVVKYQDNVLRHQAESAWKKKDFKEVIKLYTCIKGKLTNLEAKRVHFASEKLKD